MSFINKILKLSDDELLFAEKLIDKYHPSISSIDNYIDSGDYEHESTEYFINAIIDSIFSDKLSNVLVEWKYDFLSTYDIFKAYKNKERFNPFINDIDEKEMLIIDEILEEMKAIYDSIFPSANISYSQNNSISNGCSTRRR